MSSTKNTGQTMFGSNPIKKADHGDGLTLQVVKGSPFLTLQGEGPFSGHPAVFIRLHGCNLKCYFCDTNFSDPDDPIWQTRDLVNATDQLASQHKIKLIVITGGEPLRLNIIPLCHALHTLNYKVQIETAGTLWLPGIQYWAEIVCSPKTPTIHPEIERHAKAFKYVIDIKQQFEGSFIPITATQADARPRLLAPPRPNAPVYLSPMDTYDDAHNHMNRQLVAKLALAHGCIAGVQLHKILSIVEPN